MSDVSIEYFRGCKQEIENEKKRKSALMSYFPKTLGTIDRTKYILVDDDKPKQEGLEEVKKHKSPQTARIKSMGTIDETRYVLQNDEKVKLKEHIESKSTKLSTVDITKDTAANIHETNGLNSQKPKAHQHTPIKDNLDFGNNQNAFNFDPWEREKTLDSINKINYLKLNGENGSTPITRPAYHKDEFEYMNKSKFDSIIEDSFNFEGGYANNKYDRGGKTKYGITEVFMEQYKDALPEKKVKPIEELTKKDAYNLYFAMWNNKRLGEIRDKNLAFVLNDYMINSNEWEVAKRVQRILNKNRENLKPDGIFGTKTLEAIHRAEKEWLIEQILIDRYNNYRNNVAEDHSQIKNYAGWINRLNKVAEIVGSGLRFDNKY